MKGYSVVRVETQYCFRNGKVKYSDLKAAKSQLNHNRKKRGKDAAIRVYRCEFCRKYHLTSREQLEPIVINNLINEDTFKELIRLQQEANARDHETEQTYTRQQDTNYNRTNYIGL